MATGKSCYDRYLHGDLGHIHQCNFTTDSTLELNESDISNSERSKSPEIQRSPVLNMRISKSKRTTDSVDRSRGRGTPSSVPVSIPDWSKILKEDYREKRSFKYEDELDGDGDSDEEMRVPPHEFLARTRMVSFSVHEGIGRTLKGRDLSRVRNAIWVKTGFED